MGTSGERPEQVAAAADILDGFVGAGVGGGPTTLITVPAGRTWVGTVALSVTATTAAASTVQGATIAVVATAGAGVTPVAGTVAAASVHAAANAAGGTVGVSASNSLTTPLVVVAPSGNPVTLTATTTITGSSGLAEYSAVGVLQ